MKLLVLSDLHLGSRASRAAARMDELARVCGGFDRVILNGDTLDRCYSDPGGDEGAMRFIELAKSRCASRNAAPEILTGNHDAAISNQHWVYLEPSKTLIFHGDCIRDFTHPTKRDDKKLRAKLEERWAELGGRPKEFVALHENYRQVQRIHLPIINPYKKAKNAVQYALSLIYPPRRPFDIVHYWMIAPKLAFQLAQQFGQTVGHAVIGHTHRPGRWQFNEMTVYNTGSFMPVSTPFAVCVEGERVEYIPLEKLAKSAPRTYGLGHEERPSALAKIQ